MAARRPRLDARLHEHVQAALDLDQVAGVGESLVVSPSTKPLTRL